MTQYYFLNKLISSFLLSGILFSCQQQDYKTIAEIKPANQNNSHSTDSSFDYETEQFADIRILRYQVPGFNNLSLQQKTILY